jgi:aldehyde dehydrogenase (NAD+)
MQNKKVISTEKLYDAQKSFFASQKTLSTAFRIQKLRGLKNEINKREKDIYKALYLDLRKSGFEAMTSETVLVEKEIAQMIKMLPLWNRPQRVKSSLINFPSRDYIIPEPYGNTLIISPWNYPFQLALTPLVGAIAAGNTAILKPSEFAPHTGKIIKEIISAVFDHEHVAVIEGDAKVATELLKRKWDNIMFTWKYFRRKNSSQGCCRAPHPYYLRIGWQKPLYHR